MATSPSGQVTVSYQPVLDVARGVAAGYQVTANPTPRADPRTERGAARAAVPRTSDGLRMPLEPDPAVAAAVVTTALQAIATLPRNTFLSIPLHARVIAAPAVATAFAARHCPSAGRVPRSRN